MFADGAPLPSDGAEMFPQCPFNQCQLIEWAMPRVVHTCYLASRDSKGLAMAVFIDSLDQKVYANGKFTSAIRGHLFLLTFAPKKCRSVRLPFDRH